MSKERAIHTEEQPDKPHPWQRTKRRVLWTIALMVALVTTVLLISSRYPGTWKNVVEERVATLIGIGAQQGQPGGEGGLKALDVGRVDHRVFASLCRGQPGVHRLLRTADDAPNYPDHPSSSV